MTPMRAARVVDHVQKIVAKPIAAPLSSRAMSCMPSRSGSAMSARLMTSRLVARRDLVEVAVGAHEREQVGEVGLAGDGDRGASGAVTASCRRTGRR